MAIETQNLSSILESSSSPESIYSSEDSKYDNFELEDLFDELKKHKNEQQEEDIQTNNENEDDEFTKIKKSITKLPKVGGTESLSGLNNTHKKKPKQYLLSAKSENVTRINDPISVKSKGVDETVTAGSKWFNMPKGELTPQTKRDLKIIEQRAALDPKRHYKKGKWKTPEYFQMGTIVQSSAEFYSSRLKNKERHNTILQSVLNDSDTKHYFKRKYDEVQAKKTSGKKAFYKKVKEARKKF
ncbi:hypothetical protein WICMUC_000604 [Wickerhamomyces mucosus]|uniref:Fcf2 pre-rRNA processing C-terminal domain-containing protein n=1 Tax=Wickerhamomyces mucosus TaxID=1378264 RepID=A0A9P8TIA8_9ASCO|nr:hypothetical protein WICMUC_000604 [Wickerhamomyces mucosus]